VPLSGELRIEMGFVLEIVNGFGADRHLWLVACDCGTGACAMFVCNHIVFKACAMCGDWDAGFGWYGWFGLDGVICRGCIGFLHI
jgi:hypothetical protein